MRGTSRPDVRRSTWTSTPPRSHDVRTQWPSWGQSAQLVVLPSPYRSLLEPLLEYIEQVQAADPAGYVTVILPEFVPRRLWHTCCTTSMRC